MFTPDVYSTGAGALIEAMRIDENGNVGIGTNDPSLPLTVHSGGDSSGMLLRLINSNVSDREVRIDVMVVILDFGLTLLTDICLRMEV